MYLTDDIEIWQSAKGRENSDEKVPTTPAHPTSS